MSRSGKSVFRMVIAVMILGALPALLASFVAPASGPYSSALSLPVVGQAFAAPYCNDKYCAGGSRHNIVCAKVIGYHCANLSGGYCTSNPC